MIATDEVFADGARARDELLILGGKTHVAEPRALCRAFVAMGPQLLALAGPDGGPQN